jgi:hypothetical protein
MKRVISKTFIQDLLEDKLEDILAFVHKDNTLDLEIRENYINIYYRGGNILKVEETNKNTYKFDFDKNYISDSDTDIINHFKNQKWNSYFPLMKQSMDFYFTRIKKEEREFQQLVVRENNYSSISTGTDYFIIDMEYDNHSNARFDLVAVEWLSKSTHRKLSNNYKPKLVVIEMKYGDNSISGTAGMKEHWKDFNLFISNSSSVDIFKDEMLSVFNQKRELGLIPCLTMPNNSNQIKQFADDIDFAFLIANHDPESSKLNTEISELKITPIKILASNLMGYGIYNDNIIDLDKFKQSHYLSSSNDVKLRNY